MRIGIFSESFEPIQNGVSTSVKTLVEQLRAQKHHVCILAPDYPDHEDESAFVMRVPSILTPLNKAYPVPFPWFPQLKRKIRNLNLDLLHSHSPWFLGILAARLSRKYGLPHVSTYHTLYDQYEHYMVLLPGQATHGLLQWWMPHYYNQCQHVIVPSRIAERSLRGYGVESPITVIPTAVPLPPPESQTESARLAVRDRWQIPPDATLLLYVGRIAKEKQVEIVLDAFDRIACEFEDARLLVVGGGPYLTEVITYADNISHGDRIILAGGLPREEIDSIYAAADLFLFGSTSETQGLVIAEARASGLPAVVARGGGASENVVNHEDGIVVNPDAGEIAQAAIRLLASWDRLSAMREACLRNAIKYTPEGMAEKVVDVYAAAVESMEPEIPTGRVA